METNALRASLSLALRQCNNSSLCKLGDAISSEACWGTLVEALEQLCTADADYLALFDILVRLEDARALILFTSAVRAREEVLRHMLERAGDLPRSVQCALVTMPECEALLVALAPSACAAAVELASDAEKRRGSQPVYASHMGALRSMRWGRATEVTP